MRRFDPNRKDRPVVIGASEAAAAMGLSKYQSPLELYLVKRGEYEPEVSREQRERMEFGSFLEPLILDRYRKRVRPEGFETGLPMLFSSAHPFCAATPDAVATSDKCARWAVDAKCTNHRMYDPSGEDETAFGEDGSDQVPVDYLIQAQQQCHVLGVDRVDFPVLFDATTMRIYRVWRDDALIESMLAAESELCRRIVAGDPPEPTMSHSTTLELLKRTRPNRSWIVKEWSQDDASKWMQLANHKSHLKSMESIVKTLETEVYASFGEASEAVFGDLRVRRIVKSNGSQQLKQIGTTQETSCRQS